MRIQSLLALACVGFAAASISECTQEDVSVYCPDNHFCCAATSGNEGTCTPVYQGCGSTGFFYAYKQENQVDESINIDDVTTEEAVPEKRTRHNRGNKGDKIHKMVQKAKEFVAAHQKPLAIAAGVLAIYFIYTRCFAAPSIVTPKKATACTCTCKNKVVPASAEKIQYTLWNPPTVVEHQPLV